MENKCASFDEWIGKFLPLSLSFEYRLVWYMNFHAMRKVRQDFELYTKNPIAMDVTPKKWSSNRNHKKKNNLFLFIVICRH